MFLGPLSCFIFIEPFIIFMASFVMFQFQRWSILFWMHDRYLLPRPVRRVLLGSAAVSCLIASALAVMQLIRASV